MLFTNSTRGIHFAKDPAVVKFEGKYFLYHSSYGDELGWCIGIAQSYNMEDWDISGEILPTQDCEKNGICAPGAIVIDDKVHVFYQTYGNGTLDSICHAVSTDGINFVKDNTNPIFRPTDDWCCGRAIDADVCIFKEKMYMYFATRDHKMKIQKIGGAVSEIDSDFSFGNWTQIINQSIISPEMIWEGECIEAPACIVNNDRLFMFYGGAYNCAPQQIGCAVSNDGTFFKRISSVPILKNGAENEWNSSESGHPFAFKDDDGKFYLFYQGSNDKGKTWYLSKVRIEFDENNMPYIIKY